MCPIVVANWTFRLGKFYAFCFLQMIWVGLVIRIPHVWGGWPALWKSTESCPLMSLILLPHVHSELRLGSCDPITASAPFERVDLVAIRRPRLGGKRPSNAAFRI